MATAANRMRAMRARRKKLKLREVRLWVPDVRLKSVRDKLARQSARLNPEVEEEAIRWAEAAQYRDEHPVPFDDALGLGS